MDIRRPIIRWSYLNNGYWIVVLVWIYIRHYICLGGRLYPVIWYGELWLGGSCCEFIFSKQVSGRPGDTAVFVCLLSKQLSTSRSPYHALPKLSVKITRDIMTPLAAYRHVTLRGGTGVLNPSRENIVARYSYGYSCYSSWSWGFNFCCCDHGSKHSQNHSLYTGGCTCCRRSCSCRPRQSHNHR